MNKASCPDRIIIILKKYVFSLVLNVDNATMMISHSHLCFYSLAINRVCVCVCVCVCVGGWVCVRACGWVGGWVNEWMIDELMDLTNLNALLTVRNEAVVTVSDGTMEYCTLLNCCDPVSVLLILSAIIFLCNY